MQFKSTAATDILNCFKGYSPLPGTFPSLAPNAPFTRSFLADAVAYSAISGKEPLVAARQKKPLHFISVLHLPFSYARIKFAGKTFPKKKNQKWKPKLAVLPTFLNLGKMQGQGKCPESMFLKAFANETSMFTGQPCILSRTARAWFSFLFFAFFFSFWKSYFTKESQTWTPWIRLLINVQG